MKNFIKCVVAFIKGILFGIAIYGLADPFIRDWCKRKLDISTAYRYYPKYPYYANSHSARMRTSYADDDEE